MSREVDKNAKETMLIGVNMVADPVASTLGAQGKLVTISTKDQTVPDGQGGYKIVRGKAITTKDGVTVAKAVTSDEPRTEAGIRMIKEVAEKTVEEVGDGTSGSTILARYMMNEGVKAINEGVNHVDYCNGIQEAVKAVTEKVKELSKPVDSQELATKIATISANNDAELGSLIGEVFGQIGLNGAVSIEEGTEFETTFDVVKGMAISSGYTTHHFINTYKGECVLENPIIVLFSGEVNTVNEITNVLGKSMQAKRPLLLIADIQNEALETVIVNRERGALDVCIVKPPSMGSTRDDLMRDISAVTGVEYITKAQGRKFSEIEPNLNGGAAKVIVSKNDTKIVGGFGTEEQLAQRKEELEENLKQSKNKKWFKSRISMLEGGVARIIVGGKTTSDMKERYDRVEDAVLATQSAAEEGYVAGGGSTFRHIALNEKKAFNASGYNPDFIKGYNLVLEACLEPEKTILKNAGQVHEETFLDRLFPPKQTEQQEYGYGFDAKEYETKVDLISRGIIDPTKVLDRCLRNASTNAITLLKTDFLIFDK